MHHLYSFRQTASENELNRSDKPLVRTSLASEATIQTNIQPDKGNRYVRFNDAYWTRSLPQDVCCELLPEWKGLDIKISQLSGGITNKLYRIQSKQGITPSEFTATRPNCLLTVNCEAHTINEMAKIGVRLADGKIHARDRRHHR